MKIYCSRNDLNKALNNVSHAVPTRTTSPILEGILIDVIDKEIKLCATDTTMIIESCISADNSENCSFVVPAKLFTSIISKLPEDELMLEYNDSKNKLSIKCAGSTSEIVCFKADDFPRIKIEEGKNVINLSKESVKKLIKKTSFAASVDDYNGILTGVLLEIMDGNMKMVAVDPFRIATYNVALEDNKDDVSVVIPAKLANDVAKIISDDGNDIMTLEVIDKKIVMNFDNNKVVINTFSGKYIDYERILNKEGDINIRIKREDLLRSIDRASLLTTVQSNNLIKLIIEEDIIVITSLSDEGNIEEKIEIIKEGDNLLIGLNSKYLKDILSVIDDEEINMNFKDQVSPCIIKPLKGDTYKYLVLPIRIN